MRSNHTSHLPADLAALHDGLQSLRAEVASRELSLSPDAPERAEMQATAAGLDADLATLRDPEADGADLDWVRSMWADIDPADPGAGYWAEVPAPAPAAEAEADAPEMELEAAL